MHMMCPRQYNNNQADIEQAFLFDLMKFYVIIAFWFLPCAVTSETTTTLSLAKLVAKQGSINDDQDKSVLAVLEQENYQNNWETYIEVYPSDSAERYIIQAEYNVPVEDTNFLTSITILSNTKGPLKSYQRRLFQVHNHAIKKWEFIGDNADCSDWKWCYQAFDVVGAAGDYVNPKNNRIQVRLRSNNNWDDVNIDYLAIEVVTGNSAPASPTIAPIVAPTNSPVNPPTNTPVIPPTSAPAVPPSLPPIAPQTIAPVPIVDPPAPSSWWMPKSSDQLTWQWQLQDGIDTSLNVNMYDIDLFDTDEATIQLLQSQGKAVVCYFSAGSYEGWRPDWAESFDFITGNQYNGNEPPFAGKMSGWDERWLDIRYIDLLRPFMAKRMAMAISKGCDAVEPDNVDAYTNGGDTGITLTAADQLAYNKMLAEEAHKVGLSIGLKNDVDQLAELVDHFDWALNEECFQYNECDGYKVFVQQNKAVFGVEYKGSASGFCSKAKAQGLSWLKKRLSLQAWRQGCEDF